MRKIFSAVFILIAIESQHLSNCDQSVRRLKKTQEGLRRLGKSQKSVKECPCQNGGVCDTADSDICHCPPPFYGGLCEMGKDDCADVTCNGRGKCIGFSGICACEPPFYGQNCELKYDKCADVNCGENGTCADGVCVCNPPFFGPNCDSEPQNECQTETCNDRGVCVGKGICVCNAPYYGPKCEFETNKCAGVSCSNQGTCADGVCVCNPPFFGTNCESKPLDKCAGVSCSNQGTCADGVCVCNAPFFGTNCENDPTKCANIDCKNGGSCIEPGICVCPKNYFGPLCEVYYLSQPEVLPDCGNGWLPVPQSSTDQVRGKYRCIKVISSDTGIDATEAATKCAERMFGVPYGANQGLAVIDSVDAFHVAGEIVSIWSYGSNSDTVHIGGSQHTDCSSVPSECRSSAYWKWDDKTPWTQSGTEAYWANTDTSVSSVGVLGFKWTNYPKQEHGFVSVPIDYTASGALCQYSMDNKEVNYCNNPQCTLNYLQTTDFGDGMTCLDAINIAYDQVSDILDACLTVSESGARQCSSCKPLW